MNPEYAKKKLDLSLSSLASAGVLHERPAFHQACRTTEAPCQVAPGAGTAQFSIPLGSDLAAFDISLMHTGLMALREYDSRLNAYRVISYQGNPGHLVDLVKDMLVGCRCSHLVENKSVH